MASDVQIIGAGIAGLACARAIAGAGHRVVVREAADTVGGRMATRVLDGRPVDLGASYLTCRDDAFRTVVDDWVRRGLAHPWARAFTVHNTLGSERTEDGPVRYGSSGGLRSLVEDLATGLLVSLDDRVTSVGPGPRVNGWPVDAVVLALPDQQARRLLDPECVEELAATDSPWSPGLAVAAGWAERRWDVDGVFVHDDPTVEWIADDGRRRADSAPVLVAHTTADFASEHLDDPDQAIGPVVDTVRSILDITDEPRWTFVQPWSDARPLRPRATPYHFGEARIGLCGDAWGSPRVETAWMSGHRLGLEIARTLG
ncbi:NAD(P)/FAD-dependent oxidoreductase [Cryptosporangium arvum]|uniref:Putative NAD/FAD-dependent oxidoreductase n=1 Tax=Cryptosporangium arvum DSM 44712 TaxID=927661 RepID=A0A010YFJ0_9ACTN|nr:FAD-dependent oxidoreductase [Cryptosporangium arvum]EXG78995.1 putative NAD/FAD-dependent oxidoreductase [Cryptosporangium arvum DSM 44712]